jgi:hypothetical protein
MDAYDTFYSVPSMLKRFPILGGRQRAQWGIYNLFMKKGSATYRPSAVAAPTASPEMAPFPPILPIKREWREAVLESVGGPGPHLM